MSTKVSTNRNRSVCVMSSLWQDPQQYFFIALVRLSEQRTVLYLVHGHENPQKVLTLINVQMGFFPFQCLCTRRQYVHKYKFRRRSLPLWSPIAAILVEIYKAIHVYSLDRLAHSIYVLAFLHLLPPPHG